MRHWLQRGITFVLVTAIGLVFLYSLLLLVSFGQSYKRLTQTSQTSNRISPPGTISMDTSAQPSSSVTIDPSEIVDQIIRGVDDNGLPASERNRRLMALLDIGPIPSATSAVDDMLMRATKDRQTFPPAIVGEVSQRWSDPSNTRLQRSVQEMTVKDSHERHRLRGAAIRNAITIDLSPSYIPDKIPENHSQPLELQTNRFPEKPPAEESVETIAQVIAALNASPLNSLESAKRLAALSNLSHNDDLRQQLVVEIRKMISAASDAPSPTFGVLPDWVDTLVVIWDDAESNALYRTLASKCDRFSENDAQMRRVIRLAASSGEAAWVPVMLDGLPKTVVGWQDVTPADRPNNQLSQWSPDQWPAAMVATIDLLSCDTRDKEPLASYLGQPTLAGAIARKAVGMRTHWSDEAIQTIIVSLQNRLRDGPPPDPASWFESLSIDADTRARITTACEELTRPDERTRVWSALLHAIHPFENPRIVQKAIDDAVENDRLEELILALMDHPEPVLWQTANWGLVQSILDQNAPDATAAENDRNTNDATAKSIEKHLLRQLLRVHARKHNENERSEILLSICERFGGTLTTNWLNSNQILRTRAADVQR